MFEGTAVTTLHRSVGNISETTGRGAGVYLAATLQCESTGWPENCGSSPKTLRSVRFFVPTNAYN
jgi:hypothetical protein